MITFFFFDVCAAGFATLTGICVHRIETDSTLPIGGDIVDRVVHIVDDVDDVIHVHDADVGECWR
jgi:hypothetical protein